MTKGEINAKQVIITIICCVPHILLSSSSAEKQHFTNSSLGTLFLTHDIVVFICSPRSAEHNLPDSPFASPTKSAAAFAHDPFTPTESEIAAAASPGRSTASFAVHRRPPPPSARVCGGSEASGGGGLVVVDW